MADISFGMNDWTIGVIDLQLGAVGIRANATEPPNHHIIDCIHFYFFRCAKAFGAV
jgi:hypothetical protein